MYKTGFSLYVSSKDNPRTILHSPVTTPLPARIVTMNFFKGRKKKRGKKTKAVKKKIVTAGELFIAGGLWTAGGNIVDAITEDSSATQIQANEVNYVEDKTKALLEIKKNQRDSISQFPWYILGYILLGLGGILMAIPALRLLRWIRASCGSSSLQEEDGSKTAAVKYHPDRDEELDFGQSPKASLSQKMKTLEQEAETSMKYPTSGYP